MDQDKIKQDRSIDPKQLDVEAVGLADIIGEWGDASVESRYKMEALELQLDRKEAELQIMVRSEPGAYDLGDKPTETSIKAAVKQIPTLVKLEDELQQATKEYWHYENAMKSLEVKRRMLEFLGDLHGKQYFAGPTIPRDLLEEWQMARQARKNGVLERQATGLRKRPITNK